MEQCVSALEGTQGTWQVLLIQRSHTGISEVRTESMGCKALSAFTDTLFKPLSCIGNVCVGSIPRSAKSVQKAYHGQSIQAPTSAAPLQKARDGQSSSGMNGGYTLPLFCSHCLQLVWPCSWFCTAQNL